MRIQLSVFGAFRDHVPAGHMHLDVRDDATVADVRTALQAYAVAQWPTLRPGLLSASAFASETSVLRDHERVPPDGRLAVLPPVSGG